LDINDLYEKARVGGANDQDRLFEVLSVRFRLFACQRIRNEEDAKEVVQDALLKVSDQYRQIEIRVSFGAWAYKVLINELRNYIRKKTRRGDLMETSDRIDGAIGAWEPDPDLEPQLVDCVRKLARRNLRYARILNLRYQGYGAEAICRKLDISANNFYVILSRARAMLKSCLEKGESI
jgi:RNA polymerase sigma-70 factor (ECF subfamily)